MGDAARGCIAQTRIAVVVMKRCNASGAKGCGSLAVATPGKGWLPGFRGHALPTGSQIQEAPNRPPQPFVAVSPCPSVST